MIDVDKLLNEMPQQKSSGKSKMIESSIMYYSDPNQLVNRMKILVGSIIAGNNSKVVKNDLSVVNDEMLKVGLIDKNMYEALYKKIHQIDLSN